MEFDEVRIERKSPVPLYFQLAEAVRDRIARGDLRPGDQLPGERLLAESAGISRMTARQAVAHLVSLGVLVVRHGVGTFVADPKLTTDPSHLRGFSDAMLERGGTVASRVLEQSAVMPTTAIADALDLELDQPVIRLVRVRTLNGVPMLLETSILAHRQCHALLEADMQSQSLYRVLERACDIRVHHARQAIEASIADSRVANALDIHPGQPMLVLEGVAFTEDDRPVEWFNAMYRGDRFRFELDGSSDRTRDRSPSFGLVMTG